MKKPPDRKPPAVVLSPCDGTSTQGPLVRPAVLPWGGAAVNHNPVGHLVHWQWIDRPNRKGRTRPCMAHTGYCAFCMRDADGTATPRKAFWLPVYSGSPPVLRVIEYSLYALEADERLDPAWKGSLRGVFVKAAKVDARRNAAVAVTITEHRWPEEALPTPFDTLGWLCRMWEVGSRYTILPEVTDGEHLLKPFEPWTDASEVPNPPTVDGGSAAG